MTMKQLEARLDALEAENTRLKDAIANAPRARRVNTGDLFPSKPDKDYVLDGPLDVEGTEYHLWARKSKYHDGYYVSIAVHTPRDPES